MFLDGLTNPLRLKCSTVQRVRQIRSIILNFYPHKDNTQMFIFLSLLSNRVDISPALFLRMLSSAGWVAGLRLATCPSSRSSYHNRERASVTGAWHNTSLTQCSEQIQPRVGEIIPDFCGNLTMGRGGEGGVEVELYLLCCEEDEPNREWASLFNFRRLFFLDKVSKN